MSVSECVPLQCLVYSINLMLVILSWCFTSSHIQCTVSIDTQGFHKVLSRTAQPAVIILAAVASQKAIGFKFHPQFIQPFSVFLL